MAKLLALDLGTTTGFAAGDPTGHVASGVWSLKPDRYSGGGMRFVKFRKNLNDIRIAVGVTHVFFEEVRNHKGVDAAHIYGGLMATLQSWCEEFGIPYSSIPVGTVKKHWCGKGNAPKEAMIAEAIRRGFQPVDDNEADALAIFDTAVKELGLDTPVEPVDLEKEFA